MFLSSVLFRFPHFLSYNKQLGQKIKEKEKKHRPPDGVIGAGTEPWGIVVEATVENGTASAMKTRFGFFQYHSSKSEEADLKEWSWKNPNRLFIAVAVSDMKDIFNSQQQISEPRLIFLN